MTDLLDAPSAITADTPDAANPSRNPFVRFGAFYRRGLVGARATLFWACLARHRKTLWWLFAALTMSSIGLLQIVNLTRGIVDNAIVDQTAPLWPYVTHIAFWAVWGLVFGFIQSQLGERLSYQIEFDLRVWLYTRIQAAELANLDKVAAGQLVTRSITDLQLIEQLLRIFPTLVGVTPLLLALAVVVIVLNPFVGVVAILALPVNMLFIRRFSNRLRLLSWAELNERAEVARAIDEPVRGIRVVKAFAREADETAKVEAATDRAYGYSMTRTRLLAKYDGWMKAVPLVVQAAVLAVGAWRLSADALTLGTFLITFQLTTGLSGLASVLDELTSAWQYLRSAQDRLAEMFALGERPVTDGRSVPDASTGLSLSAVGAAAGQTRVLDDFSLDVAPGELVLVTGAPGSGKSTLAAVSAGLLPITGGRATLEGVPLDELDPAELRRAIRLASEEPLLLSGSLRDNLRLGAWEALTDDDLLAVLRIAGAEEVLEQIVGGLDGHVGDRGLTVSGGQRQRIALARALASHPQVLVLDDALSAVNPSLEVEIMRRVREYLPNSAILLITRRDGLAAIADRHVALPPRAEHPSNVPADHAARVDEAVALVAHEPISFDASGIDDELDHLVALEESGLAVERMAGPADLSPVNASGAMLDGLALSGDTVSLADDVVYRDDLDRFGPLLRPFRGLVAFAAVLVVALSISQIMPDLVFGAITNVISADASDSELRIALIVAAALATVAVLTGFISWQFRIVAQRVSQGVILILRRRVFKRLTKLGVDYYDRELPGDVATRIVADLDNILRFAQGPGFIIISRLTITVVGLLTIVLLAPPTWPIVLIMTGLILAVTPLQLPLSMQAFGWAREELGAVTRMFQEDFAARQELRHLGAIEVQTRRFVEACWNRRRARWWATTVQNLQNALITFLATIMSALLLWRTGEAVLALTLSIGTALAVQVLSNTATLPLRTVGPLYSQFLDVRVSWRRLREPFDVAVLPVEPDDASPCDAIRSVTFDDVSFTYPSTEREVLHGLSFTIGEGRLTALVGYTGAGKSSIAKVLTRTYDPDHGRVQVDGVDIRRFDLGSYRSAFGIVPQDPFLFKGTVASNVRYGEPAASDADVSAAIDAVGAGPVLASLTGGLGAVVEEEGRNLTAAQRQLLALARAWLTRPGLLVLDEATSLLDPATEDHIIDSVRRLGCTTLLITHRETVAARADHVVVLDAGRVVDEGTVEQVARPGGPYRLLWQASEPALSNNEDHNTAIRRQEGEP